MFTPRFLKNFVSMPHPWPWRGHGHRCPFSSCPCPPNSSLYLDRVIQWPIFIEVYHYINTLSHKDFPWLGHGTDFFWDFWTRIALKITDISDFLIMLTWFSTSKTFEKNITRVTSCSKKRTRHASLSWFYMWVIDMTHSKDAMKSEFHDRNFRFFSVGLLIKLQKF